MGFAAGAGLPAVQAISTVTAPPMPSTNPRSHSASSDVVEAALRERNALVSSSKRTIADLLLLPGAPCKAAMPSRHPVPL